MQKFLGPNQGLRISELNIHFINKYLIAYFKISIKKWYLEFFFFKRFWNNVPYYNSILYRTDFRIAVLRIARICFLRSMSEIEEQEKKKLNVSCCTKSP